MCLKRCFILLIFCYFTQANPATKFKRLTLDSERILENKLDENNRKLEAIISRMTKIESVISLNLEKISETILERNLRLEISESNYNRKIITFNQKLDHLDRKIEDNFSKLHVFVQNLNTKADVTEKVLTRITEDLQSEISDAIYAIDELKGTQSTIEENILHKCNKSDDKLLAMLNKTIVSVANTDNHKLLLEMRKEIKADLNDYASKVADMTFDMWENQKSIIKLVKSIEESVSNKLATGVVDKSVRNNNEESIFALDDQDDKFTEIADNFQKVLSNQQIFLDNCHRLQMDERQIEDEISEILKKLVHLMDQRQENENKDLKNLEKALKNHDNHIYRNLDRANVNILNLFEKVSKNDEHIIKEIKTVGLVNKKLTPMENDSSKLENDRILKGINQTEDNLINKIDNQTQIIENSLQDIKNATNQIATDLNKNLKEIFDLSSKQIARNNSNKNSSLDDLILDIFGTPPGNADNSTDFQGNSSNVNYLKLIDVRIGQDNDDEDNLSITTTENPNKNIL